VELHTSRNSADDLADTLEMAAYLVLRDCAYSSRPSNGSPVVIILDRGGKRKLTLPADSFREKRGIGDLDSWINEVNAYQAAASLS